MDIDDATRKSQFGAKDEHFRNPGETREAGKGVDDDGKSHTLIKRKGQVDSWKTELSEESLKYYRKHFE